MSHLHHKVSALIDGELQGASRRRALAHARACPDCRRELEQTYALKQRLLGLAAAEPPADLFAALGSVRTTPFAHTTCTSRVTTARRVLVGAGSMSLAVVTLAYVVGGTEPPKPTVSPPVNEFAAEFAGSTGLDPLSDPAVQAFAVDPTTGQGSPGQTALSQVAVSQGTTATGDDPRAVQWLKRAGSAPSRVPYTGVRRVTWFGSGGESGVNIEIRHTPRQGTSYSMLGDPKNSMATFIAQSEAASSGSVMGESVDLLIGAYDVSLSGTDLVGGRRATIITAGRDGATAARFWIDDATGLLLKREMYDHGRLVRVSQLVQLRTGVSGFMRHLPPALEAPAATNVSTQFAPTLNDNGWACPAALPNDFRLTLLHRLQGTQDIMHAAYSDGLSTVSVFEERGTLDTSALAAYTQITSRGSSLWVQEGLPTVVVWQAEGTIYTMVTDAPRSTAAELVAALPHQTDPTPDSSRLGRGLSRIGSYLDLGS